LLCFFDGGVEKVMRKEIATIMIVALIVMGIVVLEVKRSIRETPVTDPGASIEDGYAGISSEGLMKEMQEEKDFVLVDVRTPDEYRTGHIRGAVNIPIGEIEKAPQYLSRNKEIILYCKSGPWSRQAYTILKKEGYSNLKVLANGIVGWKWEVHGEVISSP
jgi:rhodanese-related sulfurtransferase